MKRFWSDILYKNGYLLIGAAWLFTLSFIFSNYWSYTSSPSGVKKSLENYIWSNERNFREFLQDTPLLGKIIAGEEADEEIKAVASKDYKIFLYEKKGDDFELLFWNTQSVFPGKDLLQKGTTPYLESLSNGQYEVIKSTVALHYREIIVLYLLPIRRQYVLESEYLRNGFVTNSNLENNYSIELSPTNFPIKSQTGDTLFYLQPKKASDIQIYDWLTIALRVLGSVFILFFLHNLSVAVSKKWGAWYGIGLLVALFTGLRVLSYSYISDNFRQFELFDPAIYGSGLIARSLGDLMINSLLFFWIVLFARLQFPDKKTTLVLKNNSLRLLLIGILSAVLLIATLVCSHVIKSLISDSQISFDVTNFFSLNIYSFFGFLVLCCVSLGYFIFTQVALIVLEAQMKKQSRYYKRAVIAVTGLVVLTFRINSPYILFELAILIWLLLYVYLVEQVELSFDRKKFMVGNVLFWIFIFSVSIASVIFFENRSKELELRKRTAEKLVVQADPSSERLLNIAVQGFTNNFFLTNLPRLQRPLDALRFKDSIINANFAAYQNKYDTDLFFYTTDNKPLAGTEKLTFEELNSIYSVQGKSTNVSGLRYYETAFDKFSYIYQREIKDSSDETIAHFFMLANPKRYSTEALYPELFKQTEDYSFEYSPDYAYAIYENDTLQIYVNDYSFPTSLNTTLPAGLEFEERQTNGYSELWYKSGNKVVVITKRSSLFMEAITLFAYLFCAFLLLMVIFQLASIIILSGFRWAILKKIVQFNIRSQIFATVLFVSIFSFMVIVTATIMFFRASYNKNNRDKLSRSIQDISKELKNKISDKRVAYNNIQVFDTSYSKLIRQQINSLSIIHNTDLNLYNSDGTLQVSSQPFVYTKGVLSQMMDPIAYYNLNRKKKIQYVQREAYGKMDYLSIYVPVLSENRKAVAYLNIPYFNSQTRLKQEISSFLVTIINLNAFIFLLAGIISLFLTNRIANSFALISSMMRDINIGKHNAAIEWKKNDEISDLVKEYNKMVEKLEESVAALAKTEREGAWREMARQVAHEIKNPLTPMKLSIQYLQKAIYNNAPNVKELSSNVAQTLIEQIEHLSRIASEFSQFANIGNAKNEVFDVNTMLSSLVSLHDVQERVKLVWEPDEEPVMVEADKTQINRLFTNLIQNAMEAIPEEQTGSVKVSEERQNGNIIFSVADTGSGIPATLIKNIFTPNFTTKTSGTGLGLAMCKGIVEQAKGKIWFETKEGDGTTFYVELPLHTNHSDI